MTTDMALQQAPQDDRTDDGSLEADEAADSRRSGRWSGRWVRRSEAVHEPPGTLTSDPNAQPTTIQLLRYSPNTVEESTTAGLDQIRDSIHESGYVTWVNVDGLSDTTRIRELGEFFGLHPLAMEDVVNTHQRSKVDEYDQALFVVTRMVSGLPLQSEQISFFLGRNYVLTFQEDVFGDSLDAVRDRLRRGKGRVRQQGPDYLLYELIDAVIDGYFPVLERLGERLDELEEVIPVHPSSQIISEIHTMRRDMLHLRRAVWPLREALQTLVRSNHPLLHPETHVYLRDAYDHTIQLMDILEVHRETCADLREFYYSTINNRTNEVMRTLTMFATVFMPLSFIAGVYGMNFEYIPELKLYWGYFVCVAVMIAVTGLQMYFFWRKGWLHSVEESGAIPTASESQPRSSLQTDEP